jgi:prepilin-type N-terminal cleavage/methylation domain-containing protein
VPLDLPLVGSRSRASSRELGFSLVELMAVIAIVALLAAIASPSFVNVLRDVRVNRSAMEVADIHRLAKARAMGRGSAVMVRFTETGGVINSGLFEVREAIQPAGGVPLPSTSCLATNWTNASVSSRQVSRFDPGMTAEYAKFKFFDWNGGAQAFIEICYSPRGRSWFRTTPAGAFTQYSCVGKLDVTNTKTGRLRHVVVPCSGAARVAL